MGKGTSGVRPWECSVCGRSVRVTNFMIRWAVKPDGDMVHTNTHAIKCHGWVAIKSREFAAVNRMTPGYRIKRYYTDRADA